MENELMIEWNEEESQPLSEWISENDRDETPGKFLTRAVEILEAATLDREYPLVWTVQPWMTKFSAILIDRDMLTPQTDLEDNRRSRSRIHIIETDNSYIRFVEIEKSRSQRPACGGLGFGSRELRDAFHRADKALRAK